MCIRTCMQHKLVHTFVHADRRKSILCSAFRYSLDRTNASKVLELFRRHWCNHFQHIAFSCFRQESSAKLRLWLTVFFLCKRSADMCWLLWFLRMHTDRKRDRRTDRDRQRQTETDRDRQRQTETDRDRQRQTETDRDRQRQTETDRDRQRQTETDRDRQRDRQPGTPPDRQPDSQAARQPGRQADTQTYRHTGTQTLRHGDRETQRHTGTHVLWNAFLRMIPCNRQT